jgi:hypothetical protein
MKRQYHKLIILIVWLAFGLAGCTTPSKPYKYESNRELKPGPGLFSGEDGYFIIYQEEKNRVDTSAMDTNGE